MAVTPPTPLLARCWRTDRDRRVPRAVVVAEDQRDQRRRGWLAGWH